MRIVAVLTFWTCPDSIYERSLVIRSQVPPRPYRPCLVEMTALSIDSPADVPVEFSLVEDLEDATSHNRQVRALIGVEKDAFVVLPIHLLPATYTDT